MSSQRQQHMQTQPRPPIALGSMETAPLMGSNQPLSPTHATANNEKQDKATQGKQTQLRGAPSFVGLTTLEYAVDEELSFINNELEARDTQKNYIESLYESKVSEGIFPKAGLNERYSKLEMWVTLPCDMLVEQVELKLASQDLFSKYLKLFKVEKSEDEATGLLLLRGGFEDFKKKIIELNTCGVTNQLKICFLYDKKALDASNSPRQEDNNASGQTRNASDKIKNEILPLINGSDEDIDDLDDEVAMISNKSKTPNQSQYKSNDLLSADDIKISIKGELTKSGGKESSKKSKATHQGDPDSDRNFNTVPRNYSDPMSKQGDVTPHQKQAEPNIRELERQVFSDPSNSDNWFVRLICKCVSNIKIIGFNCSSIPAITNMSHFMNSSFYLKKEKYLMDAMELDFLVGVLMISTKRYTQSGEAFRKIQAQYLRKIETNQQDKENAKHKNDFIQQQKKLQTNQLHIRSAILELLVSESMCQAQQINEKILSLKRMTDLYMGKPVAVMTFSPQIFNSEDPYTAMIKNLPQMLRFIIMCMTHKKEIVKLAAAKQLEFILETQGCSLDGAMVAILKAIMKTYPGILNQVSNQKEKGLPQQESFQASMFTNSVSDFVASPRHQKNDLASIKSKNTTQRFKAGQDGALSLSEPSEVSCYKEPSSGFNQALKNVYSHVLDTYISVLSSISSHILHHLFYEVIIPTLTCSTTSTDSNVLQPINEIKIFAMKIAEKIITICQGDLYLSKKVLDSFLVQTTTKQNNSDQLQSSMKSLWSSIKTKVFTNYSQRGLKTLIEWLVEKLSTIGQNDQGDQSKSSQDIARMEVTDEELQQLSTLIDIVSMIALSTKKNEEEANSLIKIKQEYCQELYLLVEPLLFWLDFSVEREERLSLFKTVYQTIKDVLDNLPPKRLDLDVLQIMIPILKRTTDYLSNNSPSLSMLKFLEIVLRDVKQGNYCQSNPDLQFFFLDMLNNFANYISYNLYEEVFSVFDKLLSMCSEVMTETVLEKCIVALVDKYTMKSKAHKNSLNNFMKSLMEVKVRNPTDNKQVKSNNNNLESQDRALDDGEISVHSKNNYFEILSEFCFFNNEDPLDQSQSLFPKDFRSPIDQHDLYIDKLQLFIDSLGMLTELHVNMFTSLITHPRFKQTLTDLLQKGETSLRLKCHEILEVVTNYYVQYCTSKTVYELAVPQSLTNTDILNGKKKTQSEVMEVEFINHERLYVSQIVVQCVKFSLEQKNDSYLQFNSLILLDFLFQNLLPVPSYQNEQLKGRGLPQNKNNQNQSMSASQDKEKFIDLETLEIDEITPEFEVSEQRYINMRLNLVFKLWPFVQLALNSAWSNIRSICYGLVCSMLKVDVRDYQSNSQPDQIQTSSLQQSYFGKLKSIVLPMLLNLLSSKESESKAGGLNILGSFCGLSYDFSKVKISKNLDFFKKNSEFVSIAIWQLVFNLQDDWDITIKEASVVLIQLCAPRDAVKYFDKVKREKDQIRFTNMLNKYGLGPGPIGGQSSLSSRSHYNINSKGSIEQEDQHMLGHMDPLKKNFLNFLGPSDNLGFGVNMEQFASDLFDQGPSNMKLNTNRGNKEEQKKVLGDIDFDANLPDFSELDEADLEGENFDFFVDGYNDEQIQEIISIFRNDFKPPKNLWIEKNPSAAFNSPDYYQEIFASAIDQFNQQQAQLQHQQQQELQRQVSSSPKAGAKAQPASLVDALEDDLVQRYENEQREKERQEKLMNDQAAPQQDSEGNFMIFERHYEDQQEGLGHHEQTDVHGSIDAEPFKFLGDSRQPETEDPLMKTSGKAKKPLQLQIIDEGEHIRSTKQNQKAVPNISEVEHLKFEDMPIKKEDTKLGKHSKSKEKKTTDDLIEEYERKINNTIHLLEEEKKKTNAKQGKSKENSEITDLRSQAAPEGNAKSTPEFKSKKDQPKMQENINVTNKDVSSKNAKKQALSYLTELQKGHLTNIDNMKLIKQINSCFNDNPYPKYPSAAAKQKQKLNKSFENILAANKHSMKINTEVSKVSKKNMSSSPKRNSSSGKKSGISKSGGATRRKYLDQNKPSNPPNKALYNMRDLNFFIKTIEKDLTDKYSKQNSKDFNSMPTTPTSILKKVEDQVKAMAQSKDSKAYMSNTCPNIAQILGSLDTQQSSKSNYALQIPEKRISENINKSSHITPSSISQVNNSQGTCSHNNLNSTQNNLEKFTFSKTQKLDLKDATNNIFQNQAPLASKEGNTHRDYSGGTKKKVSKVSPKREDKVLYANLLKSKKEKSLGPCNKKSRGSHEKHSYRTGNQPASSSSSQSKLNKSANSISSHPHQPLKKEQLNKSMICPKLLSNNISPNSKRSAQQMLLSQLTHGGTTMYQTPGQNHHQMTNYSSNQLYDHIYNSEQLNRKVTGGYGFNNAKTPQKAASKYKVGNYSEILEVSPSSGEKEARHHINQQLFF